MLTQAFSITPYMDFFDYFYAKQIAY